MRIKMFAGIFTVLLLVNSSMVQAKSDKCKKAKLQLTNKRSQEIKVTKVEYYDYDVKKWRKEAVGVWKIAPKSTEYKLQNLAYVKDDKTKVRYSYKYSKGGSRWSSTKTAYSTKKKCVSNKKTKFQATAK